MTSEKRQRPQEPRHIAIIMDGNGRWAKQRGLPRLAGHRAGVENIRRILTECVEQGIRYLTIYAFSTENWSRPSAEVEGLMRIFSEFLDRETRNLYEQGVQLRHLGSMEGVSPLLQRKTQAALDLTRDNDRITLCVAFNYGGRADIVAAVRALVAEGGVNNFVVDSWSALMAPKGTPPAILNRIATEVDRILASPAIQKLFADRGYAAMGGGPDAYRKYMDAEIEKWAKVIKSANVSVN